MVGKIRKKEKLMGEIQHLLKMLELAREGLDDFEKIRTEQLDSGQIMFNKKQCYIIEHNKSMVL